MGYLDTTGKFEGDSKRGVLSSITHQLLIRSIASG
jgi:hypothetical protein